MRFQEINPNKNTRDLLFEKDFQSGINGQLYIDIAVKEAIPRSLDSCFQLFYLINRMFPCANWLSPRCDDRSIDVETDCTINAGLIDVQLNPNQNLTRVDLTKDIWPSQTCQSLNCGRAKVGLRLLI